MGVESNRKGIRRRRFLVRSGVIGISLLTLATMLTGASLAQSSGAPTKTLEFWTYHAQDKELWEAAAQKVGGITINTQIFDNQTASAKFIAAFQAGQAPDFLNMNSGVGTFGALGDGGQILPLADKVPDLATNFNAQALASVGSNGVAYGIPSTQQVVQLWVNKTVAPELAALGKDGPATWDELIALGDSLKAKGIPLIGMMGNTAGLLQFTFAAIAATSLSDEFVDKLLKGEAKFTDPEMVNVFKKFQQLAQYAQPGAAAASYDDVLSGVGTGKIASFVAGSWIPADMVARNYPVPDGQFLFPGDKATDRRLAASYYDGGWAVNASGKNIDTTVELMKYAATPEFGQLIADVQGNIPAISDKYPPTITDPHLARSVELIKQVWPQSWWQFSPFDAGNPGINSLLPPAVQGILTGQMTPEQAAQSVQDGLATWYPFK